MFSRDFDLPGVCRYKVVNSRRMASAMAALLYDRSVPRAGPTYASATGGPGLSATISFLNGTVGSGGLVLVNASYPDDPGRLPPFNLGWPEVC